MFLLCSYKLHKKFCFLFTSQGLSHASRFQIVQQIINRGNVSHRITGVQRPQNTQRNILGNSCLCLCSYSGTVNNSFNNVIYSCRILETSGSSLLWRSRTAPLFKNDTKIHVKIEKEMKIFKISIFKLMLFLPIRPPKVMAPDKAAKYIKIAAEKH